MFARTRTISERKHKKLVLAIASRKGAEWLGTREILFTGYMFVLFADFALCVYHFKTLKYNLTFPCLFDKVQIPESNMFSCSYFTLQHHSQNILCILHRCASVLVSLCPGKSHFCLARANLICYHLHFLYKIILLPFIPVCCTLETGVFLSYWYIQNTPVPWTKFTILHVSATVSENGWEGGQGQAHPSLQVRSRIWNLLHLAAHGQ